MTHPRVYTDGRVWTCCDQIFRSLGAALNHCDTSHRTGKLTDAPSGRLPPFPGGAPPLEG